jgi:hypothetical protein
MRSFRWTRPTGAIRALIGGRDINHSKFNRARRQASAGFVVQDLRLRRGLANGIPASQNHHGRAGRARSRSTGPSGGRRTSTGEFEGDMTLREAFRRSINTVAIKLADEEVGLETVAQTAASRHHYLHSARSLDGDRVGRRADDPDGRGLLRHREPGEPTFAPRHCPRVESPDGVVLWEPSYTPTRVLEPEVARLMVSLLEQAANYGTGGRLRSEGQLPYEFPPPERPARPTTTPTSGSSAPRPTFRPRSGSAWTARSESPTTPPGAPWRHRSSASSCATYTTGTARTTAGARRRSSPAPSPGPMEGLLTREVDRQTGLLASEWCPEERRYVEWYIPGTEPSAVCDESTRSRFPLRWW